MVLGIINLTINGGITHILLITMVIGIGMVIIMVIGMHTIMVITMDIMQTTIIATPAMWGLVVHLQMVCTMVTEVVQVQILQLAVEHMVRVRVLEVKLPLLGIGLFFIAQACPGLMQKSAI